MTRRKAAPTQSRIAAFDRAYWAACKAFYDTCGKAQVMRDAAIVAAMKARDRAPRKRT